MRKFEERPSIAGAECRVSDPIRLSESSVPSLKAPEGWRSPKAGAPSNPLDHMLRWSGLANAVKAAGVWGRGVVEGHDAAGAGDRTQGVPDGAGQGGLVFEDVGLAGRGGEGEAIGGAIADELQVQAHSHV